MCVKTSTENRILEQIVNSMCSRFCIIDFAEGVLCSLQRKWAVVKWPFRFTFMADSMIWQTKRVTPYFDSNGGQKADPVSSFFSRSILIQFKSNCKSIILVAMTCVRFFYDTTNRPSSNNESISLDDIIECSLPCILTFVFGFIVVGTFMFVALDKHKFPSYKIHIKIVLRFFTFWTT